jgi:hypothetical protein
MATGLRYSSPTEKLTSSIIVSTSRSSVREDEKLDGTVLDGELILTTQNDLPTRQYAVFDIYCLSGNMAAGLPLARSGDDRLKAAKKALNMPETTTPHRHDEAETS